ncbi:unnamed protein product, partial [marine sediment metagenome]
VSLLRAAGAVLIGKTATVEFAGVGAIPDTRNPFDLDYSPGGSSAGSGAAVGAGLVPLALATQTGGSTIRPGSFCGVAAFKPTWGRVSVEGLKPFAPGLDTVGWIASDATLLEAVAAAYGIESERDSGEEKRLRIGFYRTPYYDEAQPETLSALEQARGLLERAGHAVEDVSGPSGSESLNKWQDILMHGEGRFSLLAEYRRDPSLAHKGVSDLVENRKGISSADMLEAYDHIAALRPQYDKALSGFDAWLTPAVPGIAPRIGDGNGLATFNRLFTALHVPCVTLPGFTGPNDLPVGIQLVAP